MGDSLTLTLFALQAGVEPHLGSAVRLLCECVLSPEPEHCHLCRGQPAPAGHEVSGKGRAGQLQLPKRLHEAFCDCDAPEQSCGNQRADHQV